MSKCEKVKNYNREKKVTGKANGRNTACRGTRRKEN